MVDLNYTLLVQLANFVVLIFILNAVLIKPMMKHLSERDNKISSSHEEAKENADRAEGLLDQYDRELAEARSKASQVYGALQQEGMAAQRQKLAEARSKAQELIDKARAEIETDAAKARQALDAEMAKLPSEIASKLLGRAV